LPGELFVPPPAPEPGLTSLPASADIVDPVMTVEPDEVVVEASLSGSASASK
jgi:hypothetical protein